MPTYEYACTECGRRLEKVQSFSDDPLTECPHCGGTLRKVFGSVGIVLKGSGFYKTDNRRSPAASSTSRGSGDSGAPSSETSSPTGGSGSESTTTKSGGTNGSGAGSNGSGPGSSVASKTA
jgi:putative FmdB family regulatory protein